MRWFTEITCLDMSLPQLHPKCVRTAPLVELFYNMRLKPTTAHHLACRLGLSRRVLFIVRRLPITRTKVPFIKPFVFGY